MLMTAVWCTATSSRGTCCWERATPRSSSTLGSPRPSIRRASRTGERFSERPRTWRPNSSGAGRSAPTRTSTPSPPFSTSRLPGGVPDPGEHPLESRTGSPPRSLRTSVTSCPGLRGRQPKRSSAACRASPPAGPDRRVSSHARSLTLSTRARRPPTAPRLLPLGSCRRSRRPRLPPRRPRPSCRPRCPGAPRVVRDVRRVVPGVRPRPWCLRSSSSPSRRRP